MEAYRLENLTFTYPNEAEPALRDVSLCIESGQFVTFCGKSGCGKTTLLRHLKGVLTPHGARTGGIYYGGVPLETLDQRAQSAAIGFVLQSPENQIVTDKVWHELAFGLESLGCDTPTIRLRVAEMASFFGIQTWFYKNVSELSGGQKQLLNLASIMVMQPSVLLLDEPTSQLDPIAAADFLATVGKINRELGVTVLMTEHRLEEAFPRSDRVIAMDAGRIIADGSAQEVGAALKNQGHDLFLAMPTPMRIYAAVGSDLPCPITVREGRAWLDAHAKGAALGAVPRRAPRADFGVPVVELKDVWFRYSQETPEVVKGLNLTVKQGQFFAIVGGNGTGKTTTLGLIAGLFKAHRGKVFLEGRDAEKIQEAEKFGGMLGVLPQNPQALFVEKTVERDLAELYSDVKLPAEDKARRLAEVTELCELAPLLARHPYDLSGGEQQRAALAKVLLLAPRILLLDEPTKGLDGHFKAKLAHILQQLQKMGTTILMVSHDIEFCARYADSCAMFFDGNLVSEGPPETFFPGNSFYTTAANRMARHLLPTAVTPEDVIAACSGGGGAVPVVAPCEGGAMNPVDAQASALAVSAEPPVACVASAAFTPEPHTPTAEKPAKSPSKKPAAAEIPAAVLQTPRGARKLSRRTMVAALLILLLIPLTIFVGAFYLQGRKYYFISMLVILETFLPFFLVFEGRRPQARELVVIAALCAIAVAGRMVFFWMPEFKPVAAVVIIAAVAFGGETGFLVGAVSMFASNMFFTQGPWTPWQMFAMGLIGLLAGLLFRKGFLRRDRAALAIFGFFATFFIYGGIMNPASILMYQPNPTWPMIVTAWLVGAPMDLVHAVATSFFLWVAAPALLEKLDRIKEKYGLVAGA